MFKIKLVGKNEGELLDTVMDLKLDIRKLEAERTLLINKHDSERNINTRIDNLEAKELIFNTNQKSFHTELEINNIKKINEIERNNHKNILDIINMNQEKTDKLINDQTKLVTDLIKSFNDQTVALVTALASKMPAISISELPKININNTQKD